MGDDKKSQVNELNFKPIIISAFIIAFFGILSIYFSYYIVMLSLIYIPIIAVLNHKNFRVNYWITLLIFIAYFILNELNIRIFGKIKINSAVNPLACLFFYGTMLVSLFTIYIESVSMNIKRISSKILYTTLIFGLIGILYLFITKPF